MVMRTKAESAISRKTARKPSLLEDIRPFTKLSDLDPGSGRLPALKMSTTPTILRVALSPLKDTKRNNSNERRVEELRGGAATQRSGLANVVTRAAYKTRVGSVKGKPKLNNQDAFIIKPALQGRRGNYLFSVLDGHGTYGHNVSQFIRDNYPQILEDALDRAATSIEKALYQSIGRLNKALLDTGIEIAYSGSTMVSVLLLGTQCVCSNIGDSRAVLARQAGVGWDAIPLSEDHNFKRLDERMRILNSNGRIAQGADADGNLAGPERVWIKDDDVPGLAMSRSIGDKISKIVGATSDPEVVIRRLGTEDKFVVLASDGVWEFISNQEAVEIVGEFWNSNQVEDAAWALVSAASKRWKKEEYVDDITVLVVFLNVPG
jgi:serine/threonine protein phosphatase PrpC